MQRFSKTDIGKKYDSHNNKQSPDLANRLKKFPEQISNNNQTWHLAEKYFLGIYLQSKA